MNLLVPPLAFLVYLLLVGLLLRAGRALAPASQPGQMKQDTYASGEAPPTRPALPGYRPFFKIALFFAVLHLGVLMLASSGGGLIAALYLGGLILVLVVLIMG